MKSMLITGGSGFFGRHFARRCLEEGYERVCIYSRDEHKHDSMRREIGDNDRMRYFVGCVRDRDRLRRAMENVETVVHAAALKKIQTGFYDPIELVKTNINGTANVIEAAMDARVKKVVGLSSDKAFEGCSGYGYSKAMAEALLLAANNMRGAHGPIFAVTRYGNVAGSTSSVIPIWREHLKVSDTVPVTDSGCTRFFMTIQEAVTLVIDTIQTMNGGELVIPELPAFRIGDLAQAMNAKMNIIGLSKFEKKHESMSFGNSSENARRMSVEELREALKHV